MINTYNNTLVILKPDSVERKLVGTIIKRIEDKGLTLLRMEMRQISRAEADELYTEHRTQSWFRMQLDFMTSGKCILMRVCNDSYQDITEPVCKIIRNMMGEYGSCSSPGTIRGDLGLDVRENLIHCTDSRSKVNRELNIFFKDEE